MEQALLQDITQTTGLYYYMTMKEFERKEERRERKKYRKLDSQEKRIIHEVLKDKLDQIFSFSRLRKFMISQCAEINNYEDLFIFFSKVNLFKFIKVEEPLNTFFPCSILDGNSAWISKNQNGHFRYFSKTPNSTTVGFDLIDLLEIFYGVSTSETIEKAIKDFKIKFMEDDWLENQNKKYLLNLSLIHGVKKRFQEEYPYLFHYLNGHLKVLETLNVIAQINVKKQEFGYKGESLFFASNSYIADFLGNYSLSTVNKVINLFAVLGLIQKVKEEHIPAQLLHESKMIAERRNLGNIISYYIIPAMIDTLEVANKRAKILQKHKIHYSNITRSKISLIFGEEFAQQVYVQKIQKNKNKKGETPRKIHLMLEKNLIEIIEKKGFATKKMVFKKYISHTTMKERESELNKIWRSLLVKYDLNYLKPTQKIKKQLRLKTNEYIAVKKGETFEE